MRRRGSRCLPALLQASLPRPPGEDSSAGVPYRRVGGHRSPSDKRLSAPRKRCRTPWRDRSQPPGTGPPYGPSVLGRRERRSPGVGCRATAAKRRNVHSCRDSWPPESRRGTFRVTNRCGWPYEELARRRAPPGDFVRGRAVTPIMGGFSLQIFLIKSRSQSAHTGHGRNARRQRLPKEPFPLALILTCWT